MLKKTCVIALWLVIGVFGLSSLAFAHCELPCGIYDDAMRIKMLKEHVMTMEKSMRKVQELQTSAPQEKNQLVRWITNKEHHANAFQEIVSQYFLTQRIKPDSEKYAEKLKVLHQMLFYAMKCKQTVDKDHIRKLYSLIDDFEGLYFGDHEHD
jgi:nickel superoxide dismutase